MHRYDGAVEQGYRPSFFRTVTILSKLLKNRIEIHGFRLIILSEVH